MHALVLVALLCRLSAARLLHSLPEDTYAFPKYKVSFLSHLPLENATAQKWMSGGLDGGELEFLGQPFPTQKEIASGDAVDATPPPPASRNTNYSLEHMRMGPHDSYLCLIPKALDPPAAASPEPELEASPAHSWSLLQPLSGSCLYHRQGWFTYSYCHNAEIRQFKERTHQHSAAPGGYRPEEDPKWEAYTLGKAPQTSTDVAVRQGSIELAHGGAGGSRYLVQTWGDGTMCDKSGKPREVQVQFHCSMAMSDTILFVKEAKTCSYVIVINTPRLCGEPGFKSTRDVNEQAYIQCREIVSDAERQAKTIEGKETQDFPWKLVRPKAQLPPPTKDNAMPGVQGNNQQQVDELFKKVSMLLASGQGVDVSGGKLVVSDDGAVMLEIVDDIPLEEFVQEEAGGDNAALRNRLMDILKSTGHLNDDEEDYDDEDDTRPLDEL